MKHEIIINQTTTKEELYDAILSIVKAFADSRNPELEPEQSKQSFILAMYQSHDKSDGFRSTLYRNCKGIELLNFLGYIEREIFGPERTTNK